MDEIYYSRIDEKEKQNNLDKSFFKKLVTNLINVSETEMTLIRINNQIK